MEYKQSRYNLLVGQSTENENILFNTYTSAMITVDSHLGEVISNKEIDLNKVSEDDYENINSLIELGFLVEKDFDEIINMDILESREKYRTDSEIHITIAPTMGCNMKCPYCFQNDNDATTYMTDEVCDSIVEFVASRLDYRPYLHVTWFGGEPLLAIPQIERISKKLIKLCQERNVHYCSSIITNGYNLTGENIKKLREECSIQAAQITIDGIGEDHNKKRILKNGRGSFEQIIENVKIASEIMNIVIRVNVDMENSEKLKELIDYLLIEQGLKGKISLGIAPVFDHDEKKDSTYNSFCKKDIWNAEALSAVKHFSGIDNIENITAASFQPSAVCCSANVYESFIFDPDGDIYKCYLVIGKKDYSIGNVHDYLKRHEIINNSKHQKWLDPTHAEECKQCVYLPICQSGCLHDRLEQNKSHICLKNKDIMKDILKESYNYYTK